jgi:glycosyltransferase involved in cell wall biosynthesis
VGRLGLSAFVHIVPQIAAEDMATLYTTADLLLFPSLYEGFGYPVLEAQMCGTPVIGSNAGSLPEVAGDAARLFDPDDVSGMADAAVSLLEDEDAAADLVHAGHRNAARFPHARWVADHVALWRELGVTPTANARGATVPA